MAKADRRVQRTRELLQQALIELLNERGYEAITVQDIVDRANVGRTTFYLHYRGKHDLFAHCHEAIVRQFQFGPLHGRSKAELLAPEASPESASAFRHLSEARALLSPIFHGPDSQVILRQMRRRGAQHIQASLQAAFPDADSSIPLEVLANYLAGAQISLMQWWLERRRPHTPEVLAQAFHRLQRAAIEQVFGPAGSQPE
jgi:AcrR family transcriptional regulator